MTQVNRQHTLVIAERPSSHREIEKVRAFPRERLWSLSSSSRRTGPFSRALSDPTRGISRQQGFLSPQLHLRKVFPPGMPWRLPVYPPSSE